MYELFPVEHRLQKSDKLIHIGTSGWNYGHWKGNFYPDKLTRNRWFRYFEDHFYTVELNTTFYSFPEKKLYERWRRQSADNFIFSIKATRQITHVKVLKDCRELLADFLSRVEGMGEKLGVILFQFPPWFNYRFQLFHEFTDMLPDKFKYTFEFRNSEWWRREVFELLEKRGMSFCIFDICGNETPLAAEAGFVYVRLHGPDGLYQGSYSDKALERWASLISGWRAGGKEVFFYFNNDQNGYAAFNAIKLNSLLHTYDIK